ncbi:MAG: sodium-dependent transporter, partial [Muribaculaceae bacterium]|nr:sodium-dependent transporter [Muribaculaceae bacterium]
TYSGYFPSKPNLTGTAITVSALDLLVALLMGFIIFPAVMSFGLADEGLEGATLVFVTLPEVFAQMPGTRFWSSLFFLLLMVAALTSTISLAEVSIAFMQKHFNMRRKKACLWVLLPLCVLSTLCSLSQGVLGNVKVAGMNIFDFLDTTATNLMLPTAAILTCIYLGWAAPAGYLKRELSNNGTLRGRFIGAIFFIVKYVAPLLIALILITRFI